MEEGNVKEVGNEEIASKRPVKLTEKATEEKLFRLLGTRRGVLSRLTTLRREVAGLITLADNLPTVQEIMNEEFNPAFQQFIEITEQLGDLLPEDEKEADLNNWFEPKMIVIRQFTEETKKWIEQETLSLQQTNQENQAEEEIDPDDSVSQVSNKPVSKKGSHAGRSSVVSSHASIRAIEEAELCALLERAAVMEKKQELEMEEARIRAAKQNLDMHAAIAEKRAKVKILKQYEKTGDGMSSYMRSHQTGGARVKEEGNTIPISQSRPTLRSQASLRPLQDAKRQVATANTAGQQLDGNMSGLLKVMENQNIITQMLVKQQQYAQLPEKKVTVFTGDPLNYRSFIRAFEQAIEQKTDSEQDKLYYLQQFTAGEPQQLVRSCEHMPAHKGFKKAKELLQKHYGDELVIGSAYIDKALKWPPIKAEDGKALQTYALFLTGCCNTMQDVELMEEMDNPTNMRMVVSKLPYKMRESWRNEAFKIKEKRGIRARFADLVAFIDRQSKVATDPLFGDLQGKNPPPAGKSKESAKIVKSGAKGTSFATNVTVEKKIAAVTPKQVSSTKTGTAFETPCLFCQGDHTLESCTKIKEKTSQERLDFLKSKGLCFGCLRQGHISQNCKKKTVCTQCSRKHPDILHQNEEGKNITSVPEQGNTQKEETSVTPSPVKEEVCGYTGAGETDCLLPVVPVKVKSRSSGRSIETYAFMDPGSTATFCTEDVRKRLNEKGKPTQISLSTMSQHEAGERALINSHLLTDLEVCSLDGEEYLWLPEVFTHSNIPVQRENIPSQQHLEKWSYLNEVSLPHLDVGVGLLIGANNSKAMEPWHVINSQEEGPYAVKTVLGWMVYGPVTNENPLVRGKTAYSVNRIAVEEVEQLLIQQYNTDFPERLYDDKDEMSQEDKLFMESVQKSTKFIDGHYSVGLPLRDLDVKMPNNRCIAEQRAAGLKRKLMKNDSFLEDYKGFMESILEKGYAMEVPQDQLSRDDNRVWYVPHHGVYHPKKKKIRVVFDCNASFQEVSLNGQLMQGPDLTNTLIGALVRFREEPIAVMADIESMFYQVRVPETDADLLRFLWWPSGDLSAPMKEYRMMVHLFGATSSPSVASYALRRTAEDRRGTTTPEAVETVLHNFYVDDCLKSVATVEEAIVLVKDLSDLCAEGGFTLTKWVSNDRRVLSTIPTELRATELRDLNLTQDVLPIERALGVQWCTENDVFTYNIKPQDKSKTRRGILSIVNSTFDPLGFLAPLILPAKLLMRDLCKEKLGWDEDIGDLRAEQWNKWLEDITLLSGFSIRRCVKPQDYGTTVVARLHHFSDASEVAYGTASYLVLMNDQGRIHCSLIMGKSRVSPLKQVTVPRLELTAAVVAVKVDRMLQGEMQIPLQQSIFWTDSTTVLKYIDNDTARYKTFVANRITLIREATKPSQWRYVRTSQNPADKATRGMKAKKFMQDKDWINGPEFLSQAECEWPQRPDNMSQNMQNDPEVKSVSVNTITVEEQPDCMNKLLEYYDSWHRLKRATAWIMKVKDLLIKLKNKRKEFQSEISQTEKDPEKQKLLVQQSMERYRSTLEKEVLTLEQLTNAEAEIIRYSQTQCFPEEINALCNGKPIKKSSQLCKLDPVFEEGILRVGGRLTKSAMPVDTKHPVLLSKHSRVAILILRDIHEKLGHSGRNYMLSQLREKFWIPQATSTIRKLISKCTVCRRLRGRVGEQKMAPLPEDRLVPDKPPFTSVGIDYFGPFEVKRGRGTVKRYGVMFTCLTIRAVHIEVAESLDTSACINVLRRFISRRGQVTTMRSDNGTNFVGTERELREALENLNQSEIEKSMQKRGIKWIFNSPAASHQGGIWERQIRSARKILSALVKEQSLTDDSLQTLLCEVESIINGRPITSVSDDPLDLEPLTPNHLLLMKNQPNFPPGIFNQDDLYTRKRWKQVQFLADLFWRRWTREYLPLLQERQKWTSQKRNFEPGDVVLVVDSSSPRNTWTMGRIIQTLPDSSGTVRRVKLQTKNSTLERSVHKICLLQEAI